MSVCIVCFRLWRSQAWSICGLWASLLESMIIMVHKTCRKQENLLICAEMPVVPQQTLRAWSHSPISHLFRPRSWSSSLPTHLLEPSIVFSVDMEGVILPTHGMILHHCYGMKSLSLRVETLLSLWVSGLFLLVSFFSNFSHTTILWLIK